MEYLDLTCKDSNLSDLDRMLSLEQRFFLSDHNLHYTDKMSMAAGIEVRVPFLGEEITKLASKIDEKLLINLFSSKRILKDSMTDYLPREIIHRSKTGFGAPIRKWVKSDLKDYIKDKITIENIKKTDILDYKGVMKLIKQSRREGGCKLQLCKYFLIVGMTSETIIHEATISKFKKWSTLFEHSK